jgi:hypothetical protein
VPLGLPSSVKYIDRSKRAKRVFAKREDGTLEETDGKFVIKNRLWVAGLFEGEGCISIQRAPNGRPQVVLILETTDADVMERFFCAVKYGNVNLSSLSGNRHKQPFRWAAGKKSEVIEILDAIADQLGERRKAQVTRALEILR